MPVTLDVNGQRYTVEPDGRRLLDVLRDDLELSGRSSPAARAPAAPAPCSLDGRPVNSCLLLAAAAEGTRSSRSRGSRPDGRRRTGGIRRGGRPPVRLLHAGPGRERDRSARARAAAEPEQIHERWRGTSAAAAPIRRSSARSCARRAWRDRALRPDAEGDGGALRGRLGARGRGRHRRVWPADAELALVGRPAARPDGPHGPPDACVTRSMCGSPGCSTRRCSDLRRARPGALARPRRCPGDTGRARRDRPRERAHADDAGAAPRAEPLYAGQPIAVVAADTPEAARAGVRALALDVEVLPHVVDAQQAVNEQRFTAEPRGRRAW